MSVLRAVLVACAAIALAAPATALAHQGNPNFLSEVRGLTPSLSGLSVEILNRDDRLLLHNTSGRTVVVDGYSGEPYARVRADGTVEVNTNSEAYYLNQDRFADAPIPKDVDPKGPPTWKALSKAGRFEWHDHRMHYMGKGRPKQVSDPAVRQKVFDWKVPVVVDGRKGSIDGTLRTIRQNLGWAFGYNLAAHPLAAAGFLDPLIAGAPARNRAESVYPR